MLKKVLFFIVLIVAAIFLAGCSSESPLGPVDPVKPDKVIPVSPADGSTVTGSLVTCSWNPAVNADAYDVYTGTTNPPAFITSTTLINYVDYPLSGTTRYWRVDSKNTTGSTISTTTGDVWSFIKS